MTVREMCETYFAACDNQHVLGKRGLPKKSSTLKTDRSRVASHILPLIGDRKAASLKLTDIQKLQRDIVDGKARRAHGPGRGGMVTGGHGAASRTLGTFGGICSWAKREGIIPASPCIGVQRHADGKRERFLTDDELRELGTAMREEDASPIGLAVIRLLLLTGFRKNEAQTLPWAWVDLNAQCIRFGTTKTTDMRSTGVQIRPLGRAACEHLAAQPKFPGCTHVFPASRAGVAGHFVGAPKVFAALCARAGIEDATLHTLRHTFGTVATVLGHSELVIGGLLGHSNGTVTGRYAHTPDPLLVAAADKVAGHIAELLA
jgi:integrase